MPNLFRDDQIYNDLYCARRGARSRLWAACLANGMPRAGPGSPSSFDSTAVKDPSIVQFENRWYLFYTARGNQKYSIGYVSGAGLHEINAALRFQLSS